MRPAMLPMVGIIERRLLINYRVDAEVAGDLLPHPLRPHLVDGSAVAGICLLRSGALRPVWVSAPIGWRGENAAHRIAVEWDGPSGVCTGVYIPERHSASWVPVAVGGRLFPGVHHHARFDVRESADRFHVAMTSATARVSADVSIGDEWSGSLFSTVEEASAFFRGGSIGWSPARRGRSLEGLQLETDAWRVMPGRALGIRSSYFESLPAGSATFDSILVMQNVPVRWSARAALPNGVPGRALPPGSVLTERAGS